MRYEKISKGELLVHGEMTSQSSMFNAYMGHWRIHACIQLRVQIAPSFSFCTQMHPSDISGWIVFVLLYDAIKGRQNGYNPGRPFFMS